LAESRKRRPNFSTNELEVLAREVSESKSLLFSIFSDIITNEKKTKKWVQITAKINSVSSCERSCTEVRKKWSDWSSAIKSKGAKIKQSQQRTGGVSRDTSPLSPL
jgi:hypothetical protein